MTPILIGRLSVTVSDADKNTMYTRSTRYLHTTVVEQQPLGGGQNNDIKYASADAVYAHNDFGSAPKAVEVTTHQPQYGEFHPAHSSYMTEAVVVPDYNVNGSDNQKY